MQEANTETLIAHGKQVLNDEAKAIHNLANRLDSSFAQACRAILACQGRVIVIGIGKSGHIAKKIAATFASTGTPAFFVHPAEAAHGDLGMITDEDLIILISKSGETEEILRFIPTLKRRGNFIISLLARNQSTLAKLSDIILDVSVEREACALNLAPTTSSTLALAMGDALAVAILQARGFNEEDFAASHPGGLLGRRLLVKIADIMHSGDKLPRITVGSKLSEAILEMSRKCLGMTAVVAKDNPDQVLGVCTDGDLRRAFEKNIDLHNALVEQVMTSKFKSIKEDILAVEALKLMQDHKISALPVINSDNKLVGALNLHNLFNAGVC